MEDKSKHLARQKRYRVKHKKELSVKGKAYRDEHQEELSAKAEVRYIENRKKRLDYRLKYTHGLTTEEFESLLTKQGGACAICQSVGGNRRLCIDHDHATDEIRGLLCDKCNLAIGLLNDSSAITKLAVKYLKFHGK